MSKFKSAVQILRRHAAQIENDLDEKIMSGRYTVDFRSYMEGKQNELEEAIALLTAGVSENDKRDSELIEYGFNKGFDAGVDEVLEPLSRLQEAQKDTVGARAIAKIGYLGSKPYKQFKPK